jgi:hypothetical protein
MKRRALMVIFFAVILIITLHARPAYAQTTTLTPVPLPTNVVYTTDGTPITSVTQQQSGTFKDNPSFFLRFQVSGADLKYPDLKDIVPHYDNAWPGLLPDEVQQNSNNPVNPLPISGVIAICTDSNGEIQLQTSKSYTTAPIEALDTLDKSARKFSVVWDPTYSHGPDDTGVFDFAKRTAVIADVAPPCGISATGTQEPKAVSTPLAQGGILAFLSKLFSQLFSEEGAHTTSSVVGKTQTNTGRSIKLLTGEGGGGTQELDTDEQKRVEEAKSSLMVYKPDRTTIKNDNSSVDNFQFGTQAIPVNFPNIFTFKELDRNAVCSQTSESDPNRPADCSFSSSGGGGCAGGTLPELGSSSCKICNPERISIYADLPETVPGGRLPDKLIGILEKAGETFNVAPSSILAVMKHEGAFNRPWLVWTDENVEKWAMCGNSMPMAADKFCDPAAVSYAVCGGAGSPACALSLIGFGWLPHYFWGNGGAGDPWIAVQKVDPSRTRETISPCNLLDAAFATAKALSGGSVTIPSTVAGNQCFSITLSNKTIPASCTAWNDVSVFQSHVSYAGYCPQTGRSNIYPPNDAFENMTLGVYRAFKCGN